MFRWQTPLCSIASVLLLLLPVFAAPNDLPSAASLYVPSLPDLHGNDENPLHIYAGYIPSDPNASTAPETAVTAHLYFLMVKARRSADKERIMFWFNGGPGCSSFDGLMMEVGPWRTDHKGGLQRSEGGWEEYTTMVYIDQPAGTGFSYTASNQYLHELSEASDHIVQFLRNFYKVFPEYSSVDTYLGGESYGGQYIPYFADAILNSNLGLPLKGIAIGNGWIDSRTQYPSYLDYAVKYGILTKGDDNYKRSKSVTDTCVSKLATYTDVYPVHEDYCETVMQTVLRGKTKTVDGKLRCLNIYDVRLYDDSPQCGMNWPPDLADMYTYLHRKDVVNAIHATETTAEWTECRGKIHQNFATKHSNASITLFPRLLERIPVMLFVGDQDIICNYMGIESLIANLHWNGETGLGTVQTQLWSVGGSPAGTWVSSRNLTYVKIFNASHMAGFDVPHVTHDMILRFMGVNFTAIASPEGSARLPSALGDDVKPIPGAFDASPTSPPTSVKPPQQEKAMWEAYYNAGSAALVLFLIALAIGGFLWWRRYRSRRSGGLLKSPRGAGLEESIPLTQNGDSHYVDAERRERYNDDSSEDVGRLRKGKGRAMELTPQETIFRVDDESDEEGQS
ncbi:alpha/beta-hydrolase [Cytidiella melzeri]|nr:alpha/beta-hydrolase [Cytidiella melzeri]